MVLKLSQLDEEILHMNIIGDIIALGGSILVVLIFVFIANYKSGKQSKYFSDRNLGERDIRQSVGASATSLAGVLLFFFNQTSIFNYLVIIVLIFNVVGIFAFLWVVKDIEPDPRKTGSVGRFIDYKTRSSEISNILNNIILIQLLFMIIIEIVLGAKIFTYFSGYKVDMYIFAIIFLAGFTCYYVIKGGLSAVVYTDGMQLKMIVIGLIMAGSFLLLNTPSGSWETALTSFITLPKLLKNLIIVFIANVILINTLLQITNPMNWQRFSAAQSKSDIIKGFAKASLFNILPIWTFAIVLAVLMEPYGAKDFSGIFDLLRGGNIFIKSVAFPIFFIGLVAALLSSIDSIFISILLHYDQSIKKEEVDTTLHVNKNRAILFTAVVVGGAVLLYFILSNAGSMEQQIVNTLFICYGLISLIAPSIIIAAKFPIKGTLGIRVGIYCGLGVIFLGAVYSWMPSESFLARMFGWPSYWGNMGGPVLAFLVASFFSMFSVELKKNGRGR
jgi:Na+/proline symporter